MFVFTHPGHSTETLTCGAVIASSWYSVSEIATTACLLALYGPMKGGATSPAIDAVFTMCASGCWISNGTNVRTPCTTPQRFTPRTHSQVESGVSHEIPPPPTPALLQKTCTAPNCRIVSAASASTCAESVTSVATPATSMP